MRVESLERWVKDNTIDVVEKMVSDCETSLGYIRQIYYGNSLSSHKLAARIEAATNSEVTRSDLRPDIFGEKAE